jgi:(p)ppGpp synthase/HD superfamily hydrolase
MKPATFDDALALVAEKFYGVLDKGGQPYILHCLRVMLPQTDDTDRQVALLHDVVEDTDVTLEYLLQQGFSEQVVSAVDALTHRDGESYAQYVIRLSQSEVATRVKLADLQDNYRLDRVAYRTDHRDQDAARIQRYILTYQFLTRQIESDVYLLNMKSL